jgi:hypothetical protein
MAKLALTQNYHIVRIRDLNGSCLWDVSLVSSHTVDSTQARTYFLALENDFGSLFRKFIPQEFLPPVRDKVLCSQLIAYGLVAAAGLQQPVSKPNYVSLWKFKKPGNHGVLHALAINYREFRSSLEFSLHPICVWGKCEEGGHNAR